VNSPAIAEEKEPNGKHVPEQAGPFPDLKVWFSSLTKETRPDMVVAIARGAVRVLQLHRIPEEYPHLLFTSDAALPFFRNAEIKGRRILLFDDSLIFGSTMAAIYEYLSARGGSVTCAAYAVDRESFFGETPHTSAAENKPSVHAGLPCLFKEKLWRPAVRQHHSRLIESILGTSSHYNLDFPTFRLELPAFGADEVPVLWEALRSIDLVEDLVDVSSPLSTNGGIHRSSAVFSPDARLLFCPSQLGSREYSKLRVTIDVPSHEIRITPVPQLMIADGTQFEDVVFEHRQLNDLWQLLDPPMRSDPFREQALFRLATSFVGIVLGQAFAVDACHTLQQRFRVKAVSLVAEDIEAILGPRNRRHLMTVLSHLRELNVTDLVATTKTSGDTAEPEDAALSVAISKVWQRWSFLRPTPQERLCEVLGKVFLTMRLVTDSDRCRKKNPKMSRLERGISYDALRKVLRLSSGIDVPSLDISLAIDASVDHGQAVPKIVRIGNTWLRAFYSGEGEYNQQLLQFKMAMHRAYAEHIRQRNVEPLSSFDLHKLCVALKDVLPWLPISTRSYTYGYFVTVGHDQEELVKWLTEGESSPLSVDGTSKRITVRKGYRSPVRATWPAERESQFFYAFHFIGTAFAKMKRDADRAKLLLTTCRTQVDTYEAVACEAHAWERHRRYDFGEFLKDTLTDVRANGTRPEALNRGVLALFWSLTYISEAAKKKHIFYEEFSLLYSRLKKAFISQGPAAKAFWQCHVEDPGLMDSTRDDDVDRAFDTLMRIVFLMAKATEFAARAVMDLDVISYERLERCFLDHKVSLQNDDFSWTIRSTYWEAAEACNKAASAARKQGLGKLCTELPVERCETDPREWLLESFRALVACHAELRETLDDVCPERESREGDRYRFAWHLKAQKPVCRASDTYQTVFRW